MEHTELIKNLVDCHFHRRAAIDMLMQNVFDEPITDLRHLYQDVMFNGTKGFINMTDEELKNEVIKDLELLLDGEPESEVEECVKSNLGYEEAKSWVDEIENQINKD